MDKNTEQKKTEFISLRISKSVKAKLEAIALQQERPLSWVVSKIIEKHVNSKQAGKL